MTPKDSADARREEIERIARVLHEVGIDSTSDVHYHPIHREDAERLYERGIRATTGLDALDAEIARREAPDYRWEPKRSPNLRGHVGLGHAMQRGELTGLKIARHLVAATPQEKPAVAECVCFVPGAAAYCPIHKPAVAERETT